MKKVRTRVITLTCNECGEEHYSRAHHDFHPCKCGNLHVDGGFDYVRFLAKDISKIKRGIRYVNATRQELYDDWNHMRDNFGRIGGRLGPNKECKLNGN